MPDEQKTNQEDSLKIKRYRAIKRMLLTIVVALILIMYVLNDFQVVDFISAFFITVLIAAGVYVFATFVTRYDSPTASVITELLYTLLQVALILILFFLVFAGLCFSLLSF